MKTRQVTFHSWKEEEEERELGLSNPLNKVYRNYSTQGLKRYTILNIHPRDRPPCLSASLLLQMLRVTRSRMTFDDRAHTHTKRSCGSLSSSQRNTYTVVSLSPSPQGQQHQENDVQNERTREKRKPVHAKIAMFRLLLTTTAY